jgi:hypothetical protein
MVCTTVHSIISCVIFGSFVHIFFFFFFDGMVPLEWTSPMSSASLHSPEID